MGKRMKKPDRLYIHPSFAHHAPDGSERRPYPAGVAFRAVREDGKRMKAHGRFFKFFMVVFFHQPFAGPLGMPRLLVAAWKYREAHPAWPQAKTVPTFFSSPFAGPLRNAPAALRRCFFAKRLSHGRRQNGPYQFQSISPAIVAIKSHRA